MRYQVGAVDDPLEHPGMAHLVEHLMFQQVLGSETLFAKLQSKTTYFNAETSLDATTYVARAQAMWLDELLSIEAVRVGFRCAGIIESTFAREREVVVNEIRQRDDATELRRAVHEAIYAADHPYRRVVGGSVESVGAITREQACAFADAHYAPGNAVLVISGDLSAARVASALGKFLARVAKRTVGPRAQVAAVGEPRRVDVPAPIDEDAHARSTPMPLDPQRRVTFRAIADTAVSLIGAEIRGRATAVLLGDLRAPMYGVVVAPASGESVPHVVDAAKRAIDGLPGVFGRTAIATLDEIVFDSVQQQAIYVLFASLESGGDRDTRLAAHVLADRDPNVVLAAEFQGLREMDRAAAASIAREQLSFDRATVVTLRATVGKKRGRTVALATAIDDPGLRRDPPDPAEAHHAAVERLPRAPAGMRTRTLPNGLDVVLLPLTSVPTVDIRLVIRSGTADEPADKRGAALVAAHALTWNYRYVNDLVLFFSGGGRNSVDVGRDHTTFTARGVDMHLDLLLAGLRRWVREGTYDGGADTIVNVMRRESKKLDDEDALTDAWRTAVFGSGHPYVIAGLARHTSGTLAVDDAERFRAAHYTPDNATLVIAGGFDAALADRWIDFLFADWKGRAEVRRSPRAGTQPASIASVSEITQVHVKVALPAKAGNRAQQLVAAEMLADIAGEIRHRLGASYSVSSQLGESRLATTYVISGSIDAARAAAALELLRDQIGLLRTDKDVAARAFVSARKRVLASLVSVTGSAEMLASRGERDAELERPPMSDLATADVVRALTIDGMVATLVDLDLSAAAVFMRGPADEVKRAFEVLGRTPVHIEHVEQDGRVAATTAATTPRKREQLAMSDLEEPLTLQGPTTSLALTLAAGYSTGRVIGSDTSGYALAGDIGYRFNAHNAVGLHFAIASQSGSFDVELSSANVPFDLIPIDLAVFAQASGYRLWGAALVGLHVQRLTKQDSSPEWDTSIGFGLQGGIDILAIGRHHVGVSGSATGVAGSQTGYGGFTIGLAYRR